jgi:hypothetical protein
LKGFSEAETIQMNNQNINFLLVIKMCSFKNCTLGSLSVYFLCIK